MNERLEKAFGIASQLVLGKKLSGLESYSGWLERDIYAKIVEAKSGKSNAPVYLPGMDFYGRIKGNVLTLAESLDAGKAAIGEDDVDALSLSSLGALSRISAVSPEVAYGQNIEVSECALFGPDLHCNRCSLAWFDKFAAYSFWPRSCEYVFGVSALLDSSFCIKCHDSARLMRCFEVADGFDCSDCMFSQGVENVRDSMFCFNTKNKRYAIGNVEMPREKYLRAKEGVLSSIVSALEKDKALGASIYNLSRA
jgi:hypothetical protein